MNIRIAVLLILIMFFFSISIIAGLLIHEYINEKSTKGLISTTLLLLLSSTGMLVSLHFYLLAVLRSIK